MIRGSDSPGVVGRGVGAVGPGAAAPVEAVVSFSENAEHPEDEELGPEHEGPRLNRGPGPALVPGLVPGLRLALVPGFVPGLGPCLGPCLPLALVPGLVPDLVPALISTLVPTLVPALGLRLELAPQSHHSLR